MLTQPDCFRLHTPAVFPPMHRSAALRPRLRFTPVFTLKHHLRLRLSSFARGQHTAQSTTLSG